MPGMIDIIMGYDCNILCDYCSVELDMRTKNLSTDEIKNEIMNGYDMGMREVAFGGGEPTIRRDLCKLAKFCRNLGFTRIKVSSNGLMYSYDSFCDEITGAGVNQFNISVMGHNGELYKSITGEEKYFHMVSKGIEKLNERGANVVLDVIMKNDTYMHLSDIIRYYHRLGCNRFILWLVSLIDRNASNRESLVSVEAMRESIFKCLDLSRELNVTTLSRHIPRCMLRGYEDHVYNLREDRVYVVTPTSRFNLWESRISANRYCDKCVKCIYYNGICMGIREDYLNKFGDREVEPYCY